MRYTLFKFVLSLSLILASPAVTLAAPAESQLTLSGNVFSYFTSQDLAVQDSNIESAYFVVHGSARNAETYFDTIHSLTRQLHRDKTTLVIAPHFKLPSDALLENEFTWTDEGWLSGDPSLANQNVSSFEVMDFLFLLVSNPLQFPNLKTIVLTGHSAGGQLTQRFAIGSLIEALIHQTRPEIKFRYIVVNPGSYAYLSNLRPGSPTPTVPASNACRYDYYKYGLQKLNGYLARQSVPELVQNYLNHDVTYLVGEKDIITAELDNDCEASLQGVTRLERAQNFKTVLDFLFPTHSHVLQIVPGIGHTQAGMYRSEIGMNALFPTPASE